MARKTNPSLAQHADALESMARDVAREHSISLSEARSRVRAELQRARDRAMSTTAVEGRRRPNPIPLEPPPHVAHDLAKLSDASLRANHDRALKQINTGAPAKRDASNRLVCWSLWEANRRGLEFDRSATSPRASNPVTGKYGFGADDGMMAPMYPYPRQDNPHGHYLDVVLGDRDTIFIDGVPVAHVGDGSAYISDQGDAGFVLHVKHHGRHYAGQVPYGLRPMQVRLVTRPHASRRVMGLPHPGHRHGNPVGHESESSCGCAHCRSHGSPNYCRICSEKLPPGASVCSHHASAPMDERWDDLSPGGRTGNPVGTRNSAMGTRVTRTHHLNENGEYDVRHWVRGEMVGDYATPSEEDAVAVQRYLTGEHHGHPRPDIEKFLGERQGPMPCRDDGRFCGGKKASSRKSNPTTPQPKTDWNKTKLSDGDKAFVRMVTGNLPVWTTEEEVVREWAQRKSLRDHLNTPLVHALINAALDAHWENILVYESVTSMRRLPKTRPSKGQPLPGLPPVRRHARGLSKPKALPAAKTPPLLPPAPHDRGDNPIGHWKY